MTFYQELQLNQAGSKDLLTVYTAGDSFYRSLKKLLRLCHYPILPSSIIFAISSAK